MDRWAQIEFFIQVAELGSLSKAAERLACPARRPADA